MIKIFGINYFAEAMLYYYRRANCLSVKGTIAETLKNFPIHRQTLEKILLPITEIEHTLDLQLDIEDSIVNKYFKKYDVPASHPFNVSLKCCLASVMVSHCLLTHLECSFDEICCYLRKCSIEERLYDFCFSIIDIHVPLYYGKCGIEEFSRQLNNSELPLEVKWNIQSAAFNYHVHIEELISLITPAAKLIEASCSKFETITEEFRRLYSSYDEQMFIETYCGYKIEKIKEINIAPLLFGYERIFAIAAASDKSDLIVKTPSSASSTTIRSLLGIVRHLTKNSDRNDVMILSEKMKALTDNIRLEILFYLCSHKAYGQELCAKFKLGHSTMSYHLTKLINAGFVTAELSGSKTYYEADKAGIQRMLDSFAEKIK